MTEDEFKPIVRATLGQLGFQCHDLEPRHGILTPDFEVHGKKDKYTIELKIKDADAAEIAKEAEALAGKIGDGSIYFEKIEPSPFFHCVLFVYIPAA